MRDDSDTTDETADVRSSVGAGIQTDSGSGEATRPRTRARLGCLIEIAQTLLITVVVFFVIQTFVAQPYEVQQASMLATLGEGHYVLVDKITPRFDSYSRGDIVVFNPFRREGSCADEQAIPLPDPTPYIKRVIGEPGEVVELRDGDVYVNEARLYEPYVRGLHTGALTSQSRWIVPEGRLFVLGDNREDSIDSRSDVIGAICINDVVGRAFLRYWPLAAFGILQTPTYADVPPVAATPVPATATSAPTTATAPSRATPVTAATPPSGSTVTPSTRASPAAVERLQVEVIARRPHDVKAYTQGLVIADGRLYEGNGYGEATLRELDPQTGAILRSINLDNRYFGEGIAVVDDRLIQLTWQEHTAFVYRLSDFQQMATFTYDTEGWGLCDDGTRLVMSDGTSRLYFRDRTTFDLLGTVDVTNGEVPVAGLNELECVDGRVYANVYPTETIVRIDPTSGKINAVIDASGLLSTEERPGDEGAVLNGIAYDAATERFLLTGKLWPWLFEVRFVPQRP